MSLQVQLQTIVACFVLGIGFGLGYGLFNRIFLRVRKSILRAILECVYDGCYTILVFYAMLHLNYGIFKVYHFIFFLLGIAYYLLMMSEGYLHIVEKVMSFFDFLFLPFNFIITRIRGILFPIKKRGMNHGDKKKKSQ